MWRQFWFAPCVVSKACARWDSVSVRELCEALQQSGISLDTTRPPSRTSEWSRACVRPRACRKHFLDGPAQGIELPEAPVWPGHCARHLGGFMSGLLLPDSCKPHPPQNTSPSARGSNRPTHCAVRLGYGLLYTEWEASSGGYRWKPRTRRDALASHQSTCHQRSANGMWQRAESERVHCNERGGYGVWSVPCTASVHRV